MKFSIGAIFFECLTGKQLVYYLGYIDQTNPNPLEKALYDSYNVIEKRLLSRITNEKIEVYKLAYNCIYNMCRLSQKDRYKTIQEVLQHPLFVTKGMTKPIPGRVKVTSVVNNCNDNIKVGLKIKSANKIAYDWGLQALKAVKEQSPLVFVVFMQLFNRIVSLAQDSSKIQLMICVSLYLTTSTVTQYGISLRQLYFLSDKQYIQQEIELEAYKSLIHLKGIIRTPSIYEETDNIYEIIWWILRSIVDCDFLSKSPKECHMIYSEMESKYPSLISSRVNKEQNCQLVYVK